MTTDEQIILNLERENTELKLRLEAVKARETRAEIALSSVGVPSGFEDGNSWDDYDFFERIHILCDMLTREREAGTVRIQSPSEKQQQEAPASLST